MPTGLHMAPDYNADNDDNDHLELQWSIQYASIKALAVHCTFNF